MKKDKSTSTAVFIESMIEKPISRHILEVFLEFCFTSGILKDMCQEANYEDIAIAASQAQMIAYYT